MNGCREIFSQGKPCRCRNTLCIAKLHGAALGKKIRQPAKIISEDCPIIKYIALQPVQVQCDTLRYLICASFPPTVLAVSGSRVKATKPNLSRMRPAPRRLSCYAIDYIIYMLSEFVKPSPKKVPCHPKCGNAGGIRSVRRPCRSYLPPGSRLSVLPRRRSWE